jgi:hypothetical protein
MKMAGHQLGVDLEIQPLSLDTFNIFSDVLMGKMFVQHWTLGHSYVQTISYFQLGLKIIDANKSRPNLWFDR